MPDLTLRVTLKDGTLDVDQSGNANQMGQGQSGNIKWQLVGNAESGTFNSQSATHPGFAWATSLNTSCFGPPPPGGGKEIVISDSNTGPNTAGVYRYQLYATIGTQEYSTTLTHNSIQVTTNPTIDNC